MAPKPASALAGYPESVAELRHDVSRWLKKGRGTSPHSQSARRLQGGECSCEENKKLATQSTVNGKLILHFPAKDLLCTVCTNNILVQTEVAIP